MKLKSTRILSVLLALAMLLTLLPAGVFAADAEMPEEAAITGEAAYLDLDALAEAGVDLCENPVQVSLTVSFYQTDMRNNLQMVNNLRTGSNAWIWKPGSTEKKVYTDLKALKWDYDLEKVAMQRAVEIALAYGHTRPNRQSCFTLHDDMGYSWNDLGENIAAGYTSVAAAQKGWEEEDKDYDGQGHRRNMLKPEFNVMGAACVKFNGYYYWVQEFAYTSGSGPSKNTSAVNGSVNAKVDVLPSICKTEISFNSTNITVAQGASTGLPSTTKRIRVQYNSDCTTWPNTATCLVTSNDNQWSIVDTSIAKIQVDNGQPKIFGLKAGSTVISVRSLNGSTSGTVTVTGNGGSSTTKNPFTDVVAGKYYYDPVLWAVEKGITNGITATTFGPEDPCTRGQVVTFLWRAAGKPEPTSSKNPFTDVKSGAYYYKAVLWAVEKGITNGMSATTFEPDTYCTRGQVVTFQWRAAGKPEPKSSSNPFTDVASGKYYSKAVLWAVEKGITSGMTKTTFGPDNVCTRGQIVTFLYRQYK